MNRSTDPLSILLHVAMLLISLTVHEYAHARAALAVGDDTAQKAGRISLNPIKHLDPVGTIMFVLSMMGGIGFGWGKPVPINPMRFRNPRWDSLLVSLAGPLSNLILAVLVAAVLRMTPLGLTNGGYLDFMGGLIAINIMLAVFNLLPIPPLDGSHILASLLPASAGRRFEWAIGRYGFMILIVLLYTRSLDNIIVPPIRFLENMIFRYIAFAGRGF